MQNDLCLEIAVEANDLNMVRLLLESGAHASTQIIPCVKAGDVDMTRLLLKFGANANTVDEDGVAPLGLVTGPVLVEPLVAAGARVDMLMGRRKNKPPLWLAFNNDHIEVAQELLRLGASPNALCGYEPLLNLLVGLRDGLWIHMLVKVRAALFVYLMHL